MNTGIQTALRERPTYRLEELHPEAQQLMRLGWQERWGTQVLGFAPIPEEPVRIGEWMITPAELDSSQLPDRAWQRVREVYAAGIRPKGWVLVHETPKLLAAPEPPRRKTWADIREQLADTGASAKRKATQAMPAAWKATKVAAGKAAPVVMEVTKVAVVATGVAVGVAAVAASAGALVFLALAASAVAVDPILIAVTDDDCWIEVDRWDVE